MWVWDKVWRPPASLWNVVAWFGIEPKVWREVGESDPHPGEECRVFHKPSTDGDGECPWDAWESILEQNPGLHTGFSTAILHRLWIFLGKNDGPVTSDNSWL